MKGYQKKFSVINQSEKERRKSMGLIITTRARKERQALTITFQAQTWLLKEKTNQYSGSSSVLFITIN